MRVMALMMIQEEEERRRNVDRGDDQTHIHTRVFRVKKSNVIFNI